DGPDPTGLRDCNNSAALDLTPPEPSSYAPAFDLAVRLHVDQSFAPGLTVRPGEDEMRQEERGYRGHHQSQHDVPIRQRGKHPDGLRTEEATPNQFHPVDERRQAGERREDPG